MSNLRLINETEVTTPANKIQITDVFSADFDIYCIEVVNTTAGTQRENNSMDIRLINSSGSEIATTSYDNKSLFFRGASDIELGSTNRNDFALLYHDTSGQNGNGNMTMWVFNPYSSSSYTFNMHQTSGQMSYPSTTSIHHNSKGVGVLKQTTSITGYSFTNRDAYDINTGIFRTYGLRVDS